MRYNRLPYSHGFSLVELSIVIVIIGLIVSSVLVGQNLVRSAEIRGLVSDYERFNQASATFKERYAGLPGDFDLNGRFGVGVAKTDTSVTPTNDLLEDDTGATSGTVHDGEYVLFWNHLTVTELLAGAFDGISIDTAGEDLSPTLPQSKAGGYWGTYSDGTDNFYIYGAAYNGTTNAYFTENALSPRDMLSVEQKLDDGRPNRGIMRARGADASDPLTDPTVAATDCATSIALDGIYRVDNNTAECTFSLLMRI